MSIDFNVKLHKPFDFVAKAICDLRDKMENMGKAIAEISETSKKITLLK